MKRLFAGLVLASIMVLSQAGLGAAATNVQLLPYTQYSSAHVNTWWTIYYSAGGQNNWWLDFGDGNYATHTQGGNVSVGVPHIFGGCGNYKQTLTVTDYSTHPWQYTYRTSWVYIYCS